MKAKTLEAILYNREALLKAKLKKEYTVSAEYRLREVQHIKRQIAQMLKEVKYETASY